MRHKFNLIGPIEPSGLSWLINCFLELGIKSTLVPEIWKERGGCWIISERSKPLAQWLPALSKVEREFHFNPVVGVEWSHDWLTSDHLGTRTIFFTREPKTALYSAYKRANVSGRNFEEFLLEIDPQWLLNRMQLWTLFHMLWWHHNDVHFFFFDNYKSDPVGTLENVLETLDLKSFTPAELLAAISKSSLEKAKEAEKKFKLVNDLDSLTFNRSGSSEVENFSEEAHGYSLIDRICTPTYLQIRKGESVDTTTFQPHLNLYLKKHPPLQKLFYNEEGKESSLSLYSHIDSRAIRYSKDDVERNYLLNVLLKKIFINFTNDIAFLINQRSVSRVERNSLRILKLFWWLFSIGIRKIIKRILRLRRV
jgi:hypothetical protein